MNALPVNIRLINLATALWPGPNSGMTRNACRGARPRSVLGSPAFSSLNLSRRFRLPAPFPFHAHLPGQRDRSVGSVRVVFLMPQNMDVRRLQMSKDALHSEQKMSDAYVLDAQRWTESLVDREHRGPGDTIDAAMWRAEQKFGIDRGIFWSLRYRPPHDIVVSVYMRLKAAYEHEVARQEARLAHELMLAKAAGLHANNSIAVAQAEAFLDKKESTPT